MNVSPLLQSIWTALPIGFRNFNCWTAAITKKHRKLYTRVYPTRLVLPDGSSINVEYDVPRKIIRLPLNLDTLSEEERQLRLQARNPVSKIETFEEEQVDFDESEFYEVKQ